ncbi:MAG: hypothetical protein IJ877_03480 [Candidatus Gastranaerophilales bacterium]|nr:hypothetical protein [Candidatus Gastranaerophilales bacterium]
MLVSGEKNNLYSKVTNKNYSSAREYLSSTYGQPKVLYYNEDTKEEIQTKKRHRIKYIALIIASATVALGITLPLLNRKKNNFSKVNELGEQVKDMHIKQKSSSTMSNFTNIKDDYWDIFAKEKLGNVNILGKHPFRFVDKIGTMMTNLYHKLVCGSFVSEWEKRQLKVLKAANEEGLSVNIPDFDKWYYSIVEQLNERLHQKGNRVTDNLINKDILKTVSGGNIADTKIQDIALDAASKIEIPEGASEKLIADIEEFNNYKSNLSETLVAKARDICIGSAPTDLLTQLISIGSLSAVVATSDTKEEKRSVIINLGIPLITALTTTTIATVKAISGAPALAFALILGQVASITARTISNAYIKHQEKKTEKLQNEQ